MKMIDVERVVKENVKLHLIFQTLNMSGNIDEAMALFIKKNQMISQYHTILDGELLHICDLEYRCCSVFCYLSMVNNVKIQYFALDYTKLHQLVTSAKRDLKRIFL